MAEIIDGKLIAEGLRRKIGLRAASLREKSGVIPGLAVVLVGDDPASRIYVNSKRKQAGEVGFFSIKREFEARLPQAELLKTIDELNGDDRIHGILVQLPLPKHINENEVLKRIQPQKDVDGFHAENIGRLWSGLETLTPCTPLGASIVLKRTFARAGRQLAGANAVIVGRSNIVGKPMAALLLKESCTVTIAHSKTADLPAVCRNADILVAAVGRARMVKGDWLKPHSVVIDVGINRIDEDGKNKLVGDVDFASASKTADFITPVPGGIGPMTIACLLANTLKAASLSADESFSLESIL